jgi:hypothetical protein
MQKTNWPPLPLPPPGLVVVTNSAGQLAYDDRAVVYPTNIPVAAVVGTNGVAIPTKPWLNVEVLRAHPELVPTMRAFLKGPYIKYGMQKPAWWDEVNHNLDLLTNSATAYQVPVTAP